MAFTLSHMAAALPFYRCHRWVSFEALLIGTMLPDLPYFLNSDVMVGQQSHQWLGLLTYCLPWGLAAFALWFWLCRPAALALIQPWCNVRSVRQAVILPHDVQYPFGLWLASNLKQYGLFWLKVMAGLMLGAMTHLLWDGTTHPDGFIAMYIGWLQYPVNVSYLGQMPVARLLQYLTSILGLCLLIKCATTRLTLKKQSGIYVKQQKTELSKWQSGLIIILLCLCSLFWGLHAAVEWHKLLLKDNYLFTAKVLVGLLQGAAGLFILYASLRWIILKLKAIQRT